jgi:hypothetical protein
MEFFPMTDDRGSLAVVNLGGEKTLRFTSMPGANLDLDYLMFIPAVGGAVTPGGAKFTKSTRNANGSITIEWTGGGTLQAAPAVTGPWQDVPGAASPYTYTPSGPALFGRIKN